MDLKADLERLNSLEVCNIGLRQARQDELGIEYEIVFLAMEITHGSDRGGPVPSHSRTNPRGVSRRRRLTGMGIIAVTAAVRSPEAETSTLSWSFPTPAMDR